MSISATLEVQRWGCAALHTLSRNELQCAAIVALGGVELLIDAMNFLRSDVEVYQFGFSALGNLASCIAVRSRIVELGGIDALVSVEKHTVLVQRDLSCGFLGFVCFSLCSRCVFP